MQLSAFTMFYRKHNQRGALSQEPYRWDSVANASKTAVSIRYALLPYWYTLFANASTNGTPHVRALFFEFPDEPELFAVDRQFMVGSDILVTPVLEPNVTTVDGIFLGRGQITWRDWYTHTAVNATVGAPTTLSAPLGHINVHIRAGAALLTHAQPAYTTRETRAGPYALLVALGVDGAAYGTAYLDDGTSLPLPDSPIANRTVRFIVHAGALTIESTGTFRVEQPLARVTVLGVPSAPGSVFVGGQEAARGGYTYNADVEQLLMDGLAVNLNNGHLSWL
ncbi:glycoside hydrolase family 31 protein [Heterobasidion irregulare TC 32-1]|uniref:Glycoside hydrolase family 31 protein n=1 Tax=Heterobasidion irregulare (strain TC 32-1) TaxID=747525 RepID=W4KBB8_HETIT|nr:glycoside hydrolase family 31 protein [Heterobasidion irregulare TC 32-1]ETW82341.1 glycoside hydrolase family 31 protein [Heterobasidion irregulare TC 32-1]